MSTSGPAAGCILRSSADTVCVKPAAIPIPFRSRELGSRAKNQALDPTLCGSRPVPEARLMSKAWCRNVMVREEEKKSSILRRFQSLYSFLGYKKTVNQ